MRSKWAPNGCNTGVVYIFLFVIACLNEKNEILYPSCIFFNHLNSSYGNLPSVIVSGINVVAMKFVRVLYLLYTQRSVDIQQIYKFTRNFIATATGKLQYSVNSFLKQLKYRFMGKSAVKKIHAICLIKSNHKMCNVFILVQQSSLLVVLTICYGKVEISS